MNEIIQLLESSKLEIEQLRRRNEILGAKVEVMDAFMLVLHTPPAYPSQGMTVDIAWEIQKKVDELKKAAVDEFLGGKPIISS